MATDVLEDLRRLCAPFDATALLRALTTDDLGPYGVDGEWEGHYHGRPRGTPGSFGGAELLAGTQALAFLASRTPIGHPVRRRLPALHRAILQRLKNPKLLLEGGAPSVKQGAKGTEAWVYTNGYLSFCPAKLTSDGQRDFLRRSQEFNWPTSTYPWYGFFSVVEVVTSEPFAAVMRRCEASGLPAGAWDADPRRSAPEVVEQARATSDLDEDAATLYLQLLTLVDCGDALIREMNGWSPAQLKRAAAPLIAKGLVQEKKQERATRGWCLPGLWEPLRPPHPAIERSKLALHDAEARDGGVAAPLGRVLPLRPLPELFAKALATAKDAAASAAPTIDSQGTDRWLANILAAPDDDTPRLVYADWLLEQGENLGEFIQVQCQLARAATPELQARETALLKANQERWLTEVNHVITGATWHRGFVTHISALAPTFAKHAALVFEKQPLLTGFAFDAVISPAQVRALAECPHLARFTSLDTSPDHYFSQAEHLETLLASQHFPAKLRWLRLGFHRPGEGLGPELVEVLVGSGKLQHLETLELAGQLLGQTLMGAGRGTKALEALLAGLPALRALRVPFNGFSANDVKAIGEKLASGLAPRLERLDFANLVDTKFITKVVQYQANRVSLAAQQALDAVLASRAGGTLPPAPPPPPATVLPQRGKYPFAEQAKSGRSSCVVCTKPIEKGALRIGVERSAPGMPNFTAWVHPDCRTQCPELQGHEDLEARLTKNSGGLWPPAAPV